MAEPFVSPATKKLNHTDVNLNLDLDTHKQFLIRISEIS